MKMLFSSFILIFSLNVFGASNNSCRELFENSDIQKTIHALAELRLNLDFAITSNDESLTTDVLLKAFQKKKERFLQYLTKHKIMDAKELDKKIKQNIELIQSEKEKEQESRRQERNLMEQGIKSSIDGSKAIFFETNNDFEMMATPVTQIIWKKIVNIVHERLKYTPLNGYEDPSHFKGDLLPVENVAPWLVVRWLAALNLLSSNNGPELSEIIPDHRSGDVYFLPTRDQWGSLIAKFPADVLHDYLSENQLEKNSWLESNSTGTTHPVAQKAPLTLSGNRHFYDLIGNVFEITNDSGLDSTAELYHYVVGGSYKTPANDIKKLAKRLDFDEQSKDAGFRLIRRRPNK